MEKHPLHLKDPKLHTSREVISATEQHDRQTGDKTLNDPSERIERYLDRLERLILDPDKEQGKKMFDGESRPRALSLLREMVMNKKVRSNKQKLAEGAARVEERAAREMGINARYGEEQLGQRGEIAVEDLEKSLDQWISYLSDANEPYPVWFRYYVFRNIIELGDYDKDKGEFTNRTPGSFRLFPDIDRGSLAYVEQMMEAAKDPKILEELQKAQRSQANNDILESELVTKAKAESFFKMSFAKQYAEGMRQSGEITPEMRAETRGEWIKYQQGTDPTALWASLQRKGTAWCTKGFATAKTQLNGGDFYVYYTLDKQGKSTIPRIAIRMDGDTKIAENPRGVLDNKQNLEPNMVDILEEKLKDFGPEADKYRKKSADMKHLTEIDNKQKSNQLLSREDLTFLYEIDTTIEGFGYDRDPRIEEIRQTRNSKEDMLIILDCTQYQIATDETEITEQTKAYLGPWNPIIYNKIKNFPNIEHLYESFPDKKIFTYKLETNPQIDSPEKAEAELKAKGIGISDSLHDLLQETRFSTESKTYNLVQFTLRQLGFKEGTGFAQIYPKAQELGLDLCPAEVGPQLCLSYGGSDFRDGCKIIAMKQITMKIIINQEDSYEDPYIFQLFTYGALLKLGTQSVVGLCWTPGTRFLFLSHK